jgi:hypothetical protein
MKWHGSHWADFCEILTFGVLIKIVNAPFFMKINQTKRQTNLTFVFPCIVSEITNDNKQDATILICLHLISVSGGTDLKSGPPNIQHQPATTSVDNTRSCSYSDMLLMMGENIARKM